jgi:hypothetical protein
MTTRPGQTLKHLPDDLAARLRALQDEDNVLLNVFLAALRGLDWPTPALAAGVRMNPPAVSKRIQRARAAAAEAEAMAPIRAAAEKGDAEASKIWGSVERRVTDYERCRAVVAAADLPEPPEVFATMDGRQLDPDMIAKLRSMQARARINGAVAADDPDRKVSEQLAELLHELIDSQGFTSYYLARVMNVSPRAISSRLERHSYRDPCPSVAGTSSGVYSGRKIGDPGVGAPRLDRHQRQLLRDLYDQHRNAGDDRERALARTALATMLRKHHHDDGYSLANLAQAMTTPQRRVRYNELRDILTAASAEVTS